MTFRANAFLAGLYASEPTDATPTWPAVEVLTDAAGNARARPGSMDAAMDGARAAGIDGSVEGGSADPIAIVGGGGRGRPPRPTGLERQRSLPGI